jgi:hypothetical protein
LHHAAFARSTIRRACFATIRTMNSFTLISESSAARLTVACSPVSAK